MLRLLVSSLLLSTLRRPFSVVRAYNHQQHIPSYFTRSSLAATCNLDQQQRYVSSAMEEPFEKMEAAGVPKCEQPSDAAKPTKKEEEEVLPKMSAQEFRVYNRMAEHMDMFVRSFSLTLRCRRPGS
jgi:hypothetical protein